MHYGFVEFKSYNDNIFGFIITEKVIHHKMKEIHRLDKCEQLFVLVG